MSARVCLCAGPLKGWSGFSGSFCFTQIARIPAICGQILWKLLFLGLEPWSGEPLCGAGAPSFSQGASEAALPLSLLSCHAQVLDQAGLRLCPLPVLMWHFFFFLEYPQMYIL